MDFQTLECPALRIIGTGSGHQPAVPRAGFSFVFAQQTGRCSPLFGHFGNARWRVDA